MNYFAIAFCVFIFGVNIPAECFKKWINEVVEGLGLIVAGFLIQFGLIAKSSHKFGYYIICLFFIYHQLNCL